MIIESIELKDYRNYEGMKIEFSPSTNIIYGDNARGKTNILEAAYISGTSKSHRGSRDKEIIRFDMSEAHIRTKVIKNDKNYQIDIHLKKNGRKGIAINHVPLKRASDIFGILNIIFFSPEDLDIIKSGPDKRRRFMDSELCQINKIYLNDLTNYNKVLNNRNKLLKDIFFKPENKKTLDVWDEQLTNYGKRIISTRRRFVSEIAPIVSKMHSDISGGREELSISYEPDIDDMFFYDELIRNREKDIRTGSTSTGPHRDDISFLINGVDIRKYGSQGQQRTCALSLKLSEIKLVEDVIGEKPVLLLDDVMSELDRKRQNDILSSLEDMQILLTCTGVDELIKSRLHIDRIFEIKDNKAVEINCTNQEEV
ncbi:MAG: DNA replication/repair protein RecF [Lachnospiraceae bacterium]|nr:DNA replication/repair protein RecF [Lachnospiraceae bacterium]